MSYKILGFPVETIPYKEDILPVLSEIVVEIDKEVESDLSKFLICFPKELDIVLVSDAYPLGNYILKDTNREYFNFVEESLPINGGWCISWGFRNGNSESGIILFSDGEVTNMFLLSGVY